MNTTSLTPNLNHDILLMIFGIVTQKISNGFTLDRPLNTIRAASQVCRHWRALLLASPRIWGRIIDLNYGRGRIEWMEEVFKRAGSSPLWISGDIRGSTGLFDKQSFFIRLLESWERIEQLSVIIYRGVKSDDIQHHFLSRAPILKVFDVTLYLYDSLFIDPLRPSQSLFADYAPLLREIKTNKIGYKLDSPWLSNIREMIPIPRELTLRELFFLLQHTPVLETIHIVNLCEVRDQIYDTSSNPLADLPKLSSIRMESTFQICAAILDNLSPEKLAQFSMDIFDLASKFTGYALSSFMQNLPRYIYSYFTSSSSTAVALKIKGTSFRFYDIPTRQTNEENFEVQICPGIFYYDPPDARENVFASFLDMITLSSTLGGNFIETQSLFKFITEIKLRLSGVQPSIIPQLYSMLAVFQHVRDIETKEHSCQTLWAVLEESSKNGRRVLFPELHTLRLIYAPYDVNRDNDNGDSADLAAFLTLFITKRKDIGFPLKKLELTTYYGSLNCARDLRALDAVAGLEVAWKQARKSGGGHEMCSYICGTGNPERLSIVL